MEKTLLSTIISRMDRWQDIANIEEQYKVRDLDTSLREQRREMQPPWALKKGSLRIFSDVLEYPVASDHGELGYLESQNIENYSNSLRFFSTSQKQFQQMVVSTRNLFAEIWDNGTKMLGINYKEDDLGSKRLSTAEVVDDYTVSEDAISVDKDTVVFKKGNASMRVSIVNTTDMAIITNTFTSFLDSKYKSKYHFRYIFLPSIPTSIEMQLRTDDSNYLTTSVTEQFSGAALKAGQWNLIAHDLNTATEVGVFDSNTIASESLILTGAATGEYYVDDSSLKEWKLLDYLYYSTFNIATDGSDVPDQKYFFDELQEYASDSSLVGDDEWIDVIMYNALLISINEEKNNEVFKLIIGKRDMAWDKFSEKYPDMVPVITTMRYRFNNNPGVGGLNRN